MKLLLPLPSPNDPILLCSHNATLLLLFFHPLRCCSIYIIHLVNQNKQNLFNAKPSSIANKHLWSENQALSCSSSLFSSCQVCNEMFVTVMTCAWIGKMVIFVLKGKKEKQSVDKKVVGEGCALASTLLIYISMSCCNHG